MINTCSLNIKILTANDTLRKFFQTKNDSSEQLPGASTHEIDSLARAQFS